MDDPGTRPLRPHGAAPAADDASAQVLDANRTGGSSNAPFFVVGAGRSGTTMLRLMLCGHSRLHVAPETWFVRDLLSLLPVARTLTQTELALALDIMTGHYRWPDLDISQDAMREDARALVAPDLRGVIDLVYARVARAAGKPRIGDKTPVYVQCLPALAALYPHAKFIHLLRDGRDVARSYIAAGWPQRCYEGSRFEWTRAVRAVQAFRSPHRMMEVRYEDLVAAPEVQMRLVCKFLDETYEPGMLRFEDRLHLVPARERSIHTGLRGTVNADAGHRPRQAQGSAQCFVMEACMARELVANGYRLRFGVRAWRPVLACARWLLIGSSSVLMRIVPPLQRRGMLRGF